VLPLLIGCALGILSGVRSGRAQTTYAGEGTGGGGRSDRCIGLAATCASYRFSFRSSVPRWCEHRVPARGAWPDAEVLLDRLDVTPPDATADVRGDLADADGRLKGVVSECYREALAARATVAGPVTVRLRFDKGSKCLRRADVVANGTGDPHLARCAADELYGMFTSEPKAAPPVAARLTLLFRRAK